MFSAGRHRSTPMMPTAIYWIGGIRQTLGDIEAAQAAYAASRTHPAADPAAGVQNRRRIFACWRCMRRSPATRRPNICSRMPPTTPIRSRCSASSEFDVEALQRDVHVVVNLISDADQADGRVAAGRRSRRSARQADRQRSRARSAHDARRGRGAAAGNRRAAVSRRSCARGRRRLLPSPRLQAALPSSSTVWRGRPAPMAATISRRSKIRRRSRLLWRNKRDGDRYLIEYIDYRSRDGYFRKYRFIFVGRRDPALSSRDRGRLEGASRFSTDMADHEWMQREEEAFLNDPGAACSTPRHYRRCGRSARASASIISASIAGSIATGNLVVFEVNASMLVHDQNEEFPYKTPFVQRIKSAFDAMLRKLATGSG